MLGHISRAVIEDQFLMESDNKLIDSSLAINCKEHNRPAVFFCAKIDSWRCFQCMINQEGLVYVDRQYKQDMQEFETIKSKAYAALNEAYPHCSLVADWKCKIRHTILKVQKLFERWVQQFTDQFMRRLATVEDQQEMNEFKDSDKWITYQIKDMQEKYTRILRIFENIQASPPEMKLDTIVSFREEMKGIEAHVTAKDKQIKSTVERLNRALKHTVDLQDLDSKCILKYQ